MIETQPKVHNKSEAKIKSWEALHNGWFQNILGPQGKGQKKKTSSFITSSSLLTHQEWSYIIKIRTRSNLHNISLTKMFSISSKNLYI